MQGSQSHHPEPTQLERFVRGELSREEARGIVRHLLARCPSCIQVTGRLWEAGEWPPRAKGDLLRLAALVRGRVGRDEPGLI